MSGIVVSSVGSVGGTDSVVSSLGVESVTGGAVDSTVMSADSSSVVTGLTASSSSLLSELARDCDTDGGGHNSGYDQEPDPPLSVPTDLVGRCIRRSPAEGPTPTLEWAAEADPAAEAARMVEAAPARVAAAVGNRSRRHRTLGIDTQNRVRLSPVADVTEPLPQLSRTETPCESSSALDPRSDMSTH